MRIMEMVTKDNMVRSFNKFSQPYHKKYVENSDKNIQVIVGINSQSTSPTTII